MIASVTTKVPPQFSEPQWKRTIGLLGISNQQADILSLILQRCRDKQICLVLEITRSTVRTQLRRVFDRLKIQDRIELILLAFETRDSLPSLSSLKTT